MEIGLSTMTKNQSHRLKEWVLYHKNLGVNHFIIYLDNCTDDSENILKSIKNTNITIYKTENFDANINNLFWISKSHKMYDNTLKLYSYLDWIIFIEVDEFIFPQKENFNFVEFLSNLKTNLLYINSWDFKPPFIETEPILHQSHFGWTDKQRFESEYIGRGKSIIKPKHFSSCIDAHSFTPNYCNYPSPEFFLGRKNYIQVIYGNDLTIDDTLLRIYHFRNHTDKDLNDYTYINY
mgnify:CR=1 FL=1